MVSAWKRIAASAKTVENTPQAPSQGSVRSSYLNPSTSKPATNVSAQSFLASISASTSPTRSFARIDSALSSIYSAIFAPNSVISSSPSLGINVTSTEPSSIITISGSTISISSSASTSPSIMSSSIPSGAAYNPFSIAILHPLNNSRLNVV